MSQKQYGKGSKWRTTNWNKYYNGYDDIDWSSKSKGIQPNKNALSPNKEESGGSKAPR